MITVPSRDAGKCSEVWGRPIVLFDGECCLCDSAVQFVIRHDPKGVFTFAPLQSPIGQELRARYGLSFDVLDTVALIENGNCHIRSDAALWIARRLAFPWWLLAAGRLIPRPLRDLAYRWIARHRYQWFGRRDSCMLPTPELAARLVSPCSQV